MTALSKVEDICPCGRGEGGDPLLGAVGRSDVGESFTASYNTKHEISHLCLCLGVLPSQSCSAGLEVLLPLVFASSLRLLVPFSC